MISPISNVNLYQPRHISIDTKPTIKYDSGHPYEATTLTIKSEEPDGSQVTWANYQLTGSSEKELDKLNKVISSIYAQDAYAEEIEPATPMVVLVAPPIGKDGDV